MDEPSCRCNEPINYICSAVVRMYCSFDVLGLTRQRAKAKPEKQGPPGLGVYSAWLGGLPGFLSGPSSHHMDPTVSSGRQCVFICGYVIM